MKSKWNHLKIKAMELRKQGSSIGSIEARLGIPRSTLSYWFKDVKLSARQKEKLHENWKNALVKARTEAVKWHNQQKANRLKIAKAEALKSIKKIDTHDKHVLELALAVLYLAEGSKKNVETALGSSDPNTLRFFLRGLEKVFEHDVNTVRCELYLRSDQDVEKIKRFWSKELSLPISNFKQVNIDRRSVGKTTYEGYYGVCGLRCGNVAIRRRLVYLAEEYFAIIGRLT